MSKHNVNPGVLGGRKVAVSTVLDTMDSVEARDIVAEAGGKPLSQSANNADTIVVSDSAAASAGTNDEPAFLRNQRSAGTDVMAESDFLALTGAVCGAGSDADRWVLVDDYLPNGKVNMENEPGYDGLIPPYKLFIQRTTRKSSSDGGWRIIDYGILSDEGGNPWYTNPNRLDDGQSQMLPSPRVSRPSTAGLTAEESQPILERYNAAMRRFEIAASRFDYRQLIGKVTVVDHWAPKSCAELFDGMTYLTIADLLRLDTSHATSMHAMFRGCTSLRDLIELDRFDTSQVTDLSEMFFNCLSLRVTSSRGWDIGRVSNINRMYDNSPVYALWDTENITKLQTLAPELFSNAMYGQWVKSN